MSFDLNLCPNCGHSAMAHLRGRCDQRYCECICKVIADPAKGYHWECNDYSSNSDISFDSQAQVYYNKSWLLNRH